MREKIKKIGGKKKEAIEGGRVGNTQMTYKDFLGQKIEAVKEVKDRKRKLAALMTETSNKITKLDEERQLLLKDLQRDFTNPAKIEEAINDKQRRFETTTLKSANDERAILNEIKKLKASLPSALKVQELKPKIDKLYEQKKETRDQLNALRDEIEIKEKEIESVRKEIEEAKEQR